MYGFTRTLKITVLSAAITVSEWLTIGILAMHGTATISYRNSRALLSLVDETVELTKLVRATVRFRRQLPRPADRCLLACTSQCTESWLGWCRRGRSWSGKTVRLLGTWT